MTQSLVTYQKPSVIINAAAGSTEDISDDIRAIFSGHRHVEPTIYLEDPEGLNKAFKTVSSDGTDLLVIYGGDGTCKSGALTARDAEIPLIALPGGTMNLLPKALYGTEDWKQALELALSQNQPRWQAAGKINDKFFFCGAMLGDPIVMSEARESFREGDVIEAVKQVPDIMTAIAHGDFFECIVDGELIDRESNGVQISCPFMSSEATGLDTFEVVTIPRLTMPQLMEIGARALAQDWRDSVHVISAHGKRIQIMGQGDFNILLDGEAERIVCPIEISLLQKGVLVLAPDLRGA